MARKDDRPHWSQFSLRTFLVLTTLAGPWLGWEIRAFQHEWKAAQEINRLGGKVSRGLGFRGLGLGVPTFRVRGIKLQGRAVNDRCVARVASLSVQLRCLENLALINTSVTRHGIEELRKLKSLRVLELAGSDIENDDLACIADLHGLTSLGLAGTLVNDDGIHHLEHIPSLVHLVLPGLQVQRDDEPDWLYRLRCESVETFSPSLTVSYRKMCQLRQRLPNCRVVQRQ